MDKNVIKSKELLIMLVVLSLLVGSCDYVQANKFAFSPTPQNGHIGGVNGVYAYRDFEESGECPYSYRVFQFYDDGTVLEGNVCSDGEIMDDWTNIKQWFNRDGVGISHGEYFISQDQIWFVTTIYDEYRHVNITTDYSGTYSESKLVLDLYSHYTGQRAEDQEYTRVDVEQ